MNKLKKKKIYNLLNYQHFLKNNSLNERKFKLKNILFENQILYKNQNSSIIEFNNYENIYIPSTVLDLKNIFTIKSVYNNKPLFNYNLDYNILYNYNKILFNYIIKKKKIIKGRVMTSNKNNKRVFIAILGMVFSMKSIHLNNLINNKNYIKNYNKQKFKHKNFFYNLKKKRIKQIIQSYKLRYLNFKIEKIKKKKMFSRISYIDEIIKYSKIKKFKKRMILEKKNKIKAIFREKNMKKNRKNR
jgi:hypothetical protein